MMRAIFALALLVGAVSALPHSSNTTEATNATVAMLGSRGGGGCTSGDDSFDYLLLVHQWPATQHSSTWPAGAKIDDFTLHGLWPSRIGSKASSYPCQCTNDAFDPSKLSSIQTDLTAHWPSYTGQDNTFWGHEWSKHGTCATKAGAGGLTDELSYFKSAIGLREKEGLLAALAKANIKPDGSKYKFADMAAAIKAAIGVNPVMGCKTGNTLSELGVCYSKSLEPQECDPSVSSQKGDEVSDCDTSVPIGFPAPGSPGPSPGPPGPSPPGPAGSCKALGCGKFHAGAPCQCSSSCTQYDDCCPDFKTTCGGPSPPGPPSPPASKCVAGKHGPPCKSDSDCTSVPDCVRCASSGFCTTTPK